MSTGKNDNKIQVIIEEPTEPSGSNFIYDDGDTKKSKKEYKEELKSIISVNQSYDFKSENSIYKGDTYNKYNKIEDNLPVWLLRYTRDKYLGIDTLDTINGATKFGSIISMVKDVVVDGIKGGIEVGIEGFIAGGIAGGIVGGIAGGIKGGIVGGIAGGKAGGKVGGIVGGITGGARGYLSNQRKGKEIQDVSDVFKLLEKVNGANAEYIDILHLSKDGFDLSKLENITTNAELKPLI